MTTSTGAQLKGIYNTSRTMGDKAISSDAALEIAGFENMWMLTKQFPWPMLSVGNEIEVPGPMGMSTVQPGQVKTYLTGPITLFESKTGHVDNLLLNLLAKLFPIKDQDDQARAIGEIARAMDASRAKFQAVLAKTRAVLPSGIRTAAPRMEAALQEKIKSLDEAIELVNEEIAALG